MEIKLKIVVVEGVVEVISTNTSENVEIEVEYLNRLSSEQYEQLRKEKDMRIVY